MSDDSLCARLDQFQISAGHDGSDVLKALDNKILVCNLPSSKIPQICDRLLAILASESLHHDHRTGAASALLHFASGRTAQELKFVDLSSIFDARILEGGQLLSKATAHCDLMRAVLERKYARPSPSEATAILQWLLQCLQSARPMPHVSTAAPASRLTVASLQANSNAPRAQPGLKQTRMRRPSVSSMASSRTSATSSARRKRPAGTTQAMRVSALGCLKQLVQGRHAAPDILWSCCIRDYGRMLLAILRDTRAGRSDRESCASIISTLLKQCNGLLKLAAHSDRKASFEAVSQTLADDVTELHHALLECLSTGLSTAPHLDIENSLRSLLRITPYSKLRPELLNQTIEKLLQSQGIASAALADDLLIVATQASIAHPALATYIAPTFEAALSQSPQLGSPHALRIVRAVAIRPDFVRRPQVLNFVVEVFASSDVTSEGPDSTVRFEILRAVMLANPEETALVDIVDRLFTAVVAKADVDAMEFSILLDICSHMQIRSRCNQQAVSAFVQLALARQLAVPLTAEDNVQDLRSLGRLLSSETDAAHDTGHVSSSRPSTSQLLSLLQRKSEHAKSEDVAAEALWQLANLLESTTSANLQIDEQTVLRIALSRSSRLDSKPTAAKEASFVSCIRLLRWLLGRPGIAEQMKIQAAAHLIGFISAESHKVQWNAIEAIRATSTAPLSPAAMTAIIDVISKSKNIKVLSVAASALLESVQPDDRCSACLSELMERLQTGAISVPFGEQARAETLIGQLQLYLQQRAPAVT